MKPAKSLMLNDVASLTKQTNFLTGILHFE